MAFDSTYVSGTLLAIPLGFITSGSLTFSPESRNDARNLGKPESDALLQSVGFIDSHVNDFGISLRYNGFAGKGIVTAMAQGATGTTSISIKEYDGNVVTRPRYTLRIKGISKKTTAPTASGKEYVIWCPSATMLGSLAVIVDTVGLSKVRNYTFNLIRVENAGGAITAGQAVAFNVVGTGTLPQVVPTIGGVPQDLVGIAAEDIQTGEVGACYSGAGGGAALIPEAVATASGAAIQAPAILNANPGGYDPVGVPVPQQIGVWKHVGGANTASILQLGTTL